MKPKKPLTDPFILVCSLEIEDILLEAGADINAKNKANRTPLMFAANTLNFDLVKHLDSKNGADTQLTDSWGQTFLHYFAFAIGNFPANSDILDALEILNLDLTN